MRYFLNPDDGYVYGYDDYQTYYIEEAINNNWEEVLDWPDLHNKEV